jgi:hypothetical protein
MLDRLCSEVVWRVLATHSIRQFPLHFPYRASPCAIMFQLDSTHLIFTPVSQLLPSPTGYINRGTYKIPNKSPSVFELVDSTKSFNSPKMRTDESYVWTVMAMPKYFPTNLPNKVTFATISWKYARLRNEVGIWILAYVPLKVYQHITQSGNSTYFEIHDNTL